ncbi:MAG: pectinesterase family protein [Nibricoccus sp.]
MKLPLIIAAVATFTTALSAATRSVPSQYSTIQAAVNAAANNDTISIANGTYTEQVNIPSSKTGLKLVGASQTGVKIRATTAATTALTVNGNDTTISYLTVENTAGATAGPALAARVNSKRVEFYRCYINGWQDTLGIWDGAVAYFKYCEIRGSVDFIYSGGTAFFETTNIKQIRDTGGPCTAPSTPQNVTYGFVFSGCTFNRSSNVANNSTTFMRPWRPYGQTVIINCSTDSHFTAAAWSPWDGREATCRAAEYGTKTLAGATVNLSTRSSWVVRLTAAQAATYSRANVLGGWTPPLL